MSVIPDDLFLKMVCPYLSPIAMYKARMIGYNTTVIRFLKQQRIDDTCIEDYVCPCCGDWLFEEWSDISELTYDHFDGFYTDRDQTQSTDGRDRFYSQSLRYKSIIRELWYIQNRDQSSGKALKTTLLNTTRRTILCRRCQLQIHDPTTISCFPYAGSRVYDCSVGNGMIYYKKVDPTIYWDEVNLKLL